MNGPIPTQLRFNFGFLLDAPVGTKRITELEYPGLRLDEVVLTPLEGEFSATRTSRGIYIVGSLETQVIAECSRCLVDVALPSTLALEALFFYPPSSTPPGELFITDGGEVDLGPVVRELSLLEIPMQVFCQPDCQGLCPVCGVNRNDETCACADDDIDPRFAALKKLLDSGDL